MLSNEAKQTSANLERKLRDKRIVQDGIELWKRQQEAARFKKLREQNEMRDMLDRCWPWSQFRPRPRGLRNLRLEGIFPDKDFQRAKRMVGTIDLGKPGGGAPMLSQSGQRLVRTHEDPILRFQWGKDLRKTVDNTLRYRTNKREQDEYKSQLDKQVAEKKRNFEKEKHDKLEFERKSTPPWGRPGPGGPTWRPPKNIGLNFLKSMGWSSEDTLRKLTDEREKYNERFRKGLENFKRVSAGQNFIDRSQSVPTRKARSINEKVHFKKRLSPLLENEVNGIELVPILAQTRAAPLKIPLASTDVTKEGPNNWKPHNSEYLDDLKKQMIYRQQYTKNLEDEGRETALRHFSTLDGFWGRPGHGAPRTVKRKGRLDYLLYPEMCRVKVY